MNTFERSVLRLNKMVTAANAVLDAAPARSEPPTPLDFALGDLRLSLIGIQALTSTKDYPSSGGSLAGIILNALAGADLDPVPTPAEAPPAPIDFELKGDQPEAWRKIQAWLKTNSTWFVLRGPAGTGKTFLLKMLAKMPNVYLTAPTNKAAKVLSKATGVPVRTTFSMLGLRMKQEEDKMVMEYGSETPYFPQGSVLVIDEGSMTGEDLLSFVGRLAKEKGIKVLVSGDPAQLPPVGEPRSPCWKLAETDDDKAALDVVIRYDNEILRLATRLRRSIFERKWHSPIKNDNHEGSGVFLTDKKGFLASLDQLKLEDFDTTKVIAWRNRTVNSYNRRIRANLGFTDEFCVGERVLLGGPVEESGLIVAHTDEEFIVKKVSDGEVWVRNGDIHVPVTSLYVEGDRALTLSIPKDNSLDDLLASKALVAKAAKGKERGAAWRDFWETKALFHSVRYGYAMTAHRAQGSTYEQVYVDQTDILANQEHREAFRCLYVAITRPTTAIHTF